MSDRGRPTVLELAIIAALIGCAVGFAAKALEQPLTQVGVSAR
jgi:hypothetical protein